MHYFDTFGWYTKNPIPGRSTAVEPPSTSETTKPGALRANWMGAEWAMWPYVAAPEVQPAREPVPETVTMRAARRALLDAGLLAAVGAALDGLPSPQREQARIDWEYAQTVERHSPFVAALAPALGLTEDDLDSLFQAASAVPA